MPQFICLALGLFFTISAFAKQMTKKDFDEVLDVIEGSYAPIVANLGGQLVINRQWVSKTKNAFADFDGNKYVVSVYGGIARHPRMTKDSLSLVVCHELGHLLGGAPLIPRESLMQYFRESLMQFKRISSEGQADYFAVLKCLRKIWINDNNNEVIRSLKVPEIVTNKCKEATKGNQEDTSLCIRTSMAGKVLANYLSVTEKHAEAKFETPDKSTVNNTYHFHPNIQCRLDTYFQASLCDASINEDVSRRNEVTGTCHGFLGHSVGTRPLCWFKPSK